MLAVTAANAKTGTVRVSRTDAAEAKAAPAD
jgi:hypothetical protein